MTLHHRAEITLLEYVSPEGAPIKIGLLLLDVERECLHMRFRTDWAGLDDSAFEILSTLSEDLVMKAQEHGALALVDHLQSTFSNMLRVTEVEAIVVSDIEAELDRRAQELLPGVAFPPMESSAISLVSSFLRTALPSVEIAKRELARGVAFSKRADTGYAVASGACVLAVLCTAVTLTQTNAPTKSHKIAGVQALTPEGPGLDGAEDFATSSSLLVTPMDRMSAIPGQRRANERRARYARRTERRVPTPTQTFTPPSMLTSSPQEVVMLAYDAPIQTPTQLTPPQFEQPSIAISPPPPERVSGVRRLLQAIVYPFKKVGQGLAN